jgi:hypothetical protein
LLPRIEPRRLVVGHVAYRAFRAAARPPKLVVTGVDRHPRYPGGERRPALDPVFGQREIYLGEYLLDYLLDLLGAIEEAPDYTSNPAAVTVEYMLKGSLVAGTDFGNERFISSLLV